MNSGGQRSRDVIYATTHTTHEQLATEEECAPYFALDDGPPIPYSQVTHLQEMGFLLKGSVVDSDNDNTVEEQQQQQQQQQQDYASLSWRDICLLRDKHVKYLHTIYNNTLKSSFVSLDASRPWMIYWCLHGMDLLGGGVDLNDEENDMAYRTVQTLRQCYTRCTVSIPQSIVQEDPILRLILQPQQEQSSKNSPDNMIVSFESGGFGGNVGHMPHAATTYAAVLALCILASSSSSSSSSNNQEETTTTNNNPALEFLQEIRYHIYPWLVSLYNSMDGSYCMHLDGECDVRAGYCVLVVLQLLNLNKTMSTAMSMQRQEYIASCQTWEGGFGSEPYGTEAHGGYTFCAIASWVILLLQRQQQKQEQSVIDHHNDNHKNAISIDESALLAWLVRRQMSYEGGFNGRSNKLVDGCYSFWQASALEIITTTQFYCDRQRLCGQPPPKHPHHDDDNSDDTGTSSSHNDPWLLQWAKNNKITTTATSTTTTLYDTDMLQRYILLCTQDPHGGLRDKPSKGRDFYHSCYCLSGLSIAQHYGRHDGGTNGDDDITTTTTADNVDKATTTTTQEELQQSSSSLLHDDHPTMVHQTHPLYNIRLEHVAFILDYFSNNNNQSSLS